MYRKTRSALVALALPVVLALAACGSSGSGGSSSGSAPGPSASAASDAGSLTIGSADFTESALLADIYADALAAKGVKVTKKLNIGERSVYVKALQDGSIDFIPE